MPKTLMTILSATCLTMLSACSTSPVVTHPTNPPISPTLLRECPQLPKLTSRLPSEVRAHFFLTNLSYSECAARHNALAAQVKAREPSK